MEGVGQDDSAPPDSGTPLVKHAVLVGSLTLLSRITGLARTVIIAHFLGTGPVAGAFRIAVMLPNMFRRFVGEGALSSAFIPLYTEYCETRSEQETQLFAERFFTLWLGALLVLTSVGSLSLGWVIPLLPDDGIFNDPVTLDLTVRLSQLAFWYLLAIACAALGQAILTARRHFAAPSFAPVVANLGFVASVFLLVRWFAPGREPYAMVCAFLFGGLCQFLFLLWPLWRAGVRLRLRLPFHDSGVQRALRLLGPGTLGAGVYQINIVVSTVLAANLANDHAVASLSNSNLILEFVLGICVMALNTVGLPQLSRHAAQCDEGAFGALVARLARLTQFITIPSSVGLLVIHVPVLSLLLESGEFGPTSLEFTAMAFRFHVLGIVFVGWNRGLVSCFHARKDMHTPLRLAVISVTVNLILAYLLSRTPLGHGGIALAATLSAMVHTVCLGVAIRRALPAVRFVGLWVSVLRSIVAAAAMGGVCLAWMAWLPMDGNKWVLGGQLFLVISTGALTYFVVAWCLQASELRWLTAAIRKRLSSSRPS